MTIPFENQKKEIREKMVEKNKSVLTQTFFKRIKFITEFLFARVIFSSYVNSP